MKFFITAKIATSVDREVQSIGNIVGQKLQAMISNKKYGYGVTEWKHTVFCNSLDFYTTTFSNEIKRCIKQESKIETNTWIDSEELRESDKKEIFRMICDSLLTSTYNLLNIKNFDYRMFRDDVVELFRQEGWIYIKFFMTSETDVIFADKIRFGRNLVAKKIKSVISTRDYGSGVNYWGHIVICCNAETYKAGYFKEIKKYTKRDKDVELRLRVDYDAMLKADEREVNKLVCKSILRGVDITEFELKIKDFDFELFRHDLTALFRKEGWI